jgi:type I restriction enzyme S subunit
LVLQAKEPRTFESHLIRCRLDTQKAAPGFYFYFFWSPQGRALMGSIVEQVAAAGIRGSDLRRLPVPLPPIDEQRRIAAVLGALDDKIELNRKMNRTLEEMAQAVFKSWFIDFDGMDASEMVDTELGPIPKGWEVSPVSEFVLFNPRVKLVRGTLAKFVEMKGLGTSGCSVLKVDTKELKGGGSKFEQGDTLLARITPCLENGKTAFVDFLDPGEAAFGSTEFIVMRAPDGVPPEWVYCLARSDEFRRHAISNMTGSSGRQRVPVDCFVHFHMAIPSSNKLREFGKWAAPAFARIKANTEQSRTLANLRDLLLPKLISGEIRIPAAEKALEAHL